MRQRKRMDARGEWNWRRAIVKSERKSGFEIKIKLGGMTSSANHPLHHVSSPEPKRENAKKYAMEHMSEYEQQRLDNIKRNQELLRSLDLQPLSNQISTPKQKQRPKQKPEPRRKEETEPRRTSARLRNLPAPDETTTKRQAEEDSSSWDAAKKRRKEGDLTLDEIGTKLTSQGDSERFAKLLEDLRTPITKPTENTGDDNANDENARPVDSNNGRSRSIPLELKKEVQNLKIRHTWSTVKVVPERIYCST